MFASEKLSTAPFQDGILVRLENRPKTDCQKWQDRKLFCEEGFYFRDALFTWVYQDEIHRTWTWPLPIMPVQAVSIGMALGLRNELPQVWLQETRISSYVLDGWAFMQTIRAGRVPPGLCRPYHGGYCEFGAGRALYFTGGIPSVHAEVTGLDFAHGMHRERTTNPWLKKISEAILSSDFNSVKDKMDCLSQNHLLDCELKAP